MFDFLKHVVSQVFAGKKALKIEQREGTPEEEIEAFGNEIQAEKIPIKDKKIEILPSYVNGFDKLIDDGGFERGSTILLSGGAGTGKTTFAIQSLYHAALQGQKGIYLSFEEDPLKIKAHMKKNYGWDLTKMEKTGLIAFVKIDPLKVARKIEGQILQKQLGEPIEIQKLKFPFKPDRIAIDSLSALSITFEEEQNYRRYIRHLFEELEGYNALTFALAETEQTPKVYSRAGIEEFLADAVIVFYNIQKGQHRRKYVEILKIRSSNHRRDLIEVRMTPHGIKILND